MRLYVCLQVCVCVYDAFLHCPLFLYAAHVSRWICFCGFYLFPFFLFFYFFLSPASSILLLRITKIGNNFVSWLLASKKRGLRYSRDKNTPIFLKVNISRVALLYLFIRNWMQFVMFSSQKSCKDCLMCVDV